MAVPPGGADLLPLLGERIGTVAPMAASRVAAAVLVEERRVAAIAAILAEALTRLREGGIVRTLIVDGPISRTSCPALALRHCGRLALLVPGGDGARAAQAMEQAGFATPSRRRPHRQVIALRHASGLPIELWDGSLAPPFAAIGHAQLAAGASDDGSLAGADRLAVILAGAVRMGEAADLRWIADVHLLIASGAIDAAAWRRWIEDGATGYLLAGALAVACAAAPCTGAASLATAPPPPALRDRIRHARSLRGSRALLRALVGL